MKRRIGALVCLLVAAALVLAACGQVTPTAQTAQKTSAAVETAASPTQPAKEQVTVSILISLPGDFGDMTPETPMYKQVMEATGINLDIAQAPEGALGQQIALRIASGDLPDLMMFEGASEGVAPFDLVAQYGAKGSFVPLDEYLKGGKMPNLKAAMDKYPEMRQIITAADGHIYGAPTINLLPELPQSPMIRADLLEECGIIRDRNDLTGFNTISTVDDLYEAFSCLHEKWGGKPVISGRDGFPTVLEAWSQFFGTSSSVYYNPYTKKYEYGAVMKRFRVMLEFMHRLYKEGILHPEYATMSDEDFSARFAAGEWSASFVGWSWTFARVKATGIDPGKDLFVQSLTIDGERILWPKRSAVLDWAPLVISAKSAPEKVEAAVRLVDYLYSPEGQVLTYFGKEGVDWKVGTDGRRCLTGNYMGEEDRILPEAFCDGKIPENVPTYFSAGYQYQPMRVFWQWVLPDWVHMFSLSGPMYPEKIQDAVAQYTNGGSWTGMVPFTRLSKDESAAVADVAISLGTFVDEESQKFVEGQRPLSDEEWAKFTAKIEELGAQKIVDLYNAALARVPQ